MDKALFPIITEDEKRLPFYVTTVGTRHSQEHVVRSNGHPEFHWLHCVNGKGKLIAESGEHEILENMGFLLHPHVPHEYRALAEPWETHWITFTGHAVPPLMNLLGLGRLCIFHVSDMPELEKLLEDIYLSLEGERTMRSFESSSLLYKFLLGLKNCISIAGEPSKWLKSRQLQPVVTYLENNSHTEPALEELASIINVTPQHLCRLFKQIYGTSPFSYLTVCRIRKAKELLLGFPRLKIKDIAKRAGYNDTSYFCSIFRKHEGMPPTEFRKMYV